MECETTTIADGTAVSPKGNVRLVTGGDGAGEYPTIVTSHIDDEG